MAKMGVVNVSTGYKVTKTASKTQLFRAPFTSLDTQSGELYEQKEGNLGLYVHRNH